MKVTHQYDLPVWQILGGKYREEVRIYAGCHGGEALESLGPLVNPRTPHWMLAEGEQSQQRLISLRHHGWDASKPDAPGLGIELDLEVAYEYRKPGQTFFTQGML